MGGGCGQSRGRKAKLRHLGQGVGLSWMGCTGQKTLAHTHCVWPPLRVAPRSCCGMRVPHPQLLRPLPAALTCQAWGKVPGEEPGKVGWGSGCGTFYLPGCLSGAPGPVGQDVLGPLLPPLQEDLLVK